jgi:hypothetical protein
MGALYIDHYPPTWCPNYDVESLSIHLQALEIADRRLHHSIQREKWVSDLILDLLYDYLSPILMHRIGRCVSFFVIGGKKCPRPEDYLVCTAFFITCGGVIKEQYYCLIIIMKLMIHNGATVWQLLLFYCTEMHKMIPSNHHSRTGTGTQHDCFGRSFVISDNIVEMCKSH